MMKWYAKVIFHIRGKQKYTRHNLVKLPALNIRSLIRFLVHYLPIYMLIAILILRVWALIKHTLHLKHRIRSVLIGGTTLAKHLRPIDNFVLINGIIFPFHIMKIVGVYRLFSGPMGVMKDDTALFRSLTGRVMMG